MDPFTLFALANGAVSAVKAGCKLYRDIKGAAGEVKDVLKDLDEQFHKLHPPDKPATNEQKKQFMEEKQRMEAELQEAAEIAKAFLPASVPPWARFKVAVYHEPLSESSGDWFAFEQARRAAIVVHLCWVKRIGSPVNAYAVIRAGHSTERVIGFDDQILR